MRQPLGRWLRSVGGAGEGSAPEAFFWRFLWVIAGVFLGLTIVNRPKNKSFVSHS